MSITVTTQSFDEMWTSFLKFNPASGTVFTAYALPNGQHAWHRPGDMPQELIDSMGLTVLGTRTVP